MFPEKGWWQRCQVEGNSLPSFSSCQTKHAVPPVHTNPRVVRAQLPAPVLSSEKVWMTSYQGTVRTLFCLMVQEKLHLEMHKGTVAAAEGEGLQRLTCLSPHLSLLLANGFSLMAATGLKIRTQALPVTHRVGNDTVRDHRETRSHSWSIALKS